MVVPAPMSVRTIGLAAVALAAVSGAVFIVARRTGKEPEPAAVPLAQRSRASDTNVAPSTLLEPREENRRKPAPSADPVTKPDTESRSPVPVAPVLKRDALPNVVERGVTEAPTRLARLEPLPAWAADPEAVKKAQSQAVAALGKGDRNPSVLRVAVWTSCATGDAKAAKKYVQRLGPGDQREMARRCEPYGVDLKVSEPIDQSFHNANVQVRSERPPKTKPTP